jgi:RNA polymerase sigma-70 factor (ECF subfamily)
MAPPPWQNAADARRTPMMDSTIERRRRFESIAGDVFDPLQRFLRRRVPRDEAEDALSDTLLIIWRRLDEVPADAVLPWSYGVARRVLSNRQRGWRRRRLLADRLSAQAPPPPMLDPSDAEAHPEVAGALADLADRDREVLVLWAWEELEPREMAVVLGISANAAALRLSRAKKRLARSLRGQDRSDDGHREDEHIEDRS